MNAEVFGDSVYAYEPKDEQGDRERADQRECNQPNARDSVKHELPRATGQPPRPDVSWERLGRHRTDTTRDVDKIVLGASRRGLMPLLGVAAEGAPTHGLPVADATFVVSQAGFIVREEHRPDQVTAAARPYPKLVTSLTVLSIPDPDALSAAIAKPHSPQHAASRYITILRAARSQNRILAKGLKGFKALFALGGGGIPATIVDTFARAMATPAALGAAIDWYRANPFPTPWLGPIKVPTLYL